MSARPGRFAPGGIALVLGVILAVVASLACTPDVTEERGEADGAAAVEIVTDDGVTLDGRLWERGSERLVIYLHEFREDQSSWWPTAERRDSGAVSAMTFDFRGHGASEGELDDVTGMTRDVHAAIEFARERGFKRIMLVGAGMGAAVGLVAAAEDPSVTVVGFSTPADFDEIDALTAAGVADGRVQLIATRDDISAADSLHQFRALDNIDTTEARLYPGGSHGVAVLEGRAGADIRARFEELLDEFWVAPAP